MEALTIDFKFSALENKTSLYLLSSRHNLKVLGIPSLAALKNRRRKLQQMNCQMKVFFSVALLVNAFGQSLFASSFDGSVFSVNVTTLMPFVVAVPMPGADSTYLAINKLTGEGIASSSGAGGTFPLFANFNVFTGNGGVTATPPTPSTFIGPFFDPLKNVFFIFVSRQGVLNFATINQQTLNLTLGGTVSFSTSQQVPYRTFAAHFSSEQRVVCALTDNEFVTCIDVDKLSVTRQSSVPNCEGFDSCSFLTYAPSMGFVLIASSNYNNGCASGVSASLLSTHNTTSRYLGGGSLTNPLSVCTFNSAAFSTANHTYIFGSNPAGYAVIEHKIGAPVTYVQPPNQPAEFLNNVETFYWSN